MVEELNGSSGLWVHRESAIILAESHDVWSFTPEFLLVNELVPDNWVCRRAVRTQDAVEIEYGPIHWHMTGSNLWISLYSDCSIEDWPSMEDRRLIPAMAESYLERVSYFPFKGLWFYWQISSVNPDRHQWMLDNFLRKEWPKEYPVTRLQPSLTFSSGDVAFQITIRSDQARRRYEVFQDSIIFDCYAYRIGVPTVGDAIQETDHWPERLLTLERALNHLMEENVSS